MSKSVLEGLAKLRAYSLESPSRIRSLASASGTQGKRAVPNQHGRFDEQIGLRSDWGEEFMRDKRMFRRLTLQVNKNAEDAWLKKLAQEDSHAVLAAADVAVPVSVLTDEEARDVVEKVFRDFKRQLDE